MSRIVSVIWYVMAALLFIKGFGASFGVIEAQYEPWLYYAVGAGVVAFARQEWRDQ